MSLSKPCTFHESPKSHLRSSHDPRVQTYSFTNHTVLPEAMEKWAVPLIAEVLPRHMMIIFDINLVGSRRTVRPHSRFLTLAVGQFFLQKVEKMFPHDRDRLGRMSIIEEGHPQYVRMSYLAVVGSHAVNGVASLHSSLLKNVVGNFSLLERLCGCLKSFISDFQRLCRLLRASKIHQRDQRRHPATMAVSMQSQSLGFDCGETREQGVPEGSVAPFEPEAPCQRQGFSGTFHGGQIS